MTRPARDWEAPRRVLLLPAVRCERCGDDMVGNLAAPVCIPCQRRAALRTAFARRAQARDMIERLSRGEAAS
jgi:hypothetical protein